MGRRKKVIPKGYAKPGRPKKIKVETLKPKINIEKAKEEIGKVKLEKLILDQLLEYANLGVELDVAKRFTNAPDNVENEKVDIYYGTKKIKVGFVEAYLYHYNNAIIDNLKTLKKDGSTAAIKEVMKFASEKAIELRTKEIRADKLEPKKKKKNVLESLDF